MVTLFIILNAMSFAANISIWLYEGHRPSVAVASLNAFALGLLVLS
jgi:hypothetical protein